MAFGCECTSNRDIEEGIFCCFRRVNLIAVMLDLVLYMPCHSVTEHEATDVRATFSSEETSASDR